MFRSLVPALVAPLFLAGACSPAVDEATPGRDALDAAARVRAVPDQVAAVVTGRVHTTFTLGDAEDEVTLTGAAAFDADAYRLALALEMRAPADTDGPGDPVLDGPFETVVAGPSAYVRGSLMEALTGQSGWLAVPAATLGRAGGVLALPGAGTDPREVLEALRGAGQVESQGRAEVRGVRTTRYDARVDLPGGSWPMSVWIDDDGLVRRLRLVLVATPLDGHAAGGRLSTVMEFFDYGEPVVITVPSPGEVTALRELAR